MIKEMKVDKLNVKICDDRKDLGAVAAADTIAAPKGKIPPGNTPLEIKKETIQKIICSPISLSISAKPIFLRFKPFIVSSFIFTPLKVQFV